MERLILAMEAAGSASENTSSDGVYIVCPEDGQRKRAVSYLSEVRALGIRGDMDYMDRSMRAQMKAAARFGAKWTVIIEPEGDSVSVRDMDASEQETMTFSSFLDKLQAVDEVNY
jgi:histidyl-tRNA synthetase